jgi:glycosyltransferase involved in cell wall biosynthesis
MKILIVIPSIGSIYGGPSQTVKGLAQALGNLDLDVDIVTTNANGSTKLDVPLHTWITEESYRIQYFPYWGWGDYKMSWSLSRWLLQHVASYDLVHTNAVFSVPNIPAYWACQLHNVPYVVTPHGMLESWAMSYKAWKKRFFYALIEKPALQKAGAIQIIGFPEADSVRSLGIETPLVFVPNGIHRQDFEKLPDPEIFYQQFPETRSKNLILFLGRVDPKKGLDLLATALTKVLVQFPQVHLVVAGPDNIGFLHKAQAYFAESNCLDAVTFTGMLTGSLKYAALAAANVYVAPSYSEGFSMSVLEGMASGLPCTITTGCNFPEAAAAQAAYVVNVDAAEIALTLTQCLNNPQQAKETGDRARQFILEKYTWERIAIEMLKVYTALVNKKHAPLFQ